MSCLMATTAFSSIPDQDVFAIWTENIIVYECGTEQCVLPVQVETYKLGAKLPTPKSKQKGYKFKGWGLKTYGYNYDNKSNCRFFQGISYGPVFNMPVTYSDLSWRQVSVTNDTYGKICPVVGLHMLAFYDSYLHGQTPLSGRFAAVAQWEMINYKVSLYFNGGYVDNSNSTKNVTGPDWTKNYTVLDDKFELPRPKKNGYVFKGWCTNQSLTYCENNPDLYDENADKKYYAKWEKVDLKPLTDLNLNKKPKPIGPINIKPVTVK